MPMMDELLVYLLIGGLLHFRFSLSALPSCLISTFWVYLCRISIMLNNKCDILTEEKQAQN